MDTSPSIREPCDSNQTAPRALLPSPFATVVVARSSCRSPQKSCAVLPISNFLCPLRASSEPASSSTACRMRHPCLPPPSADPWRLGNLNFCHPYHRFSSSCHRYGGPNRYAIAILAGDRFLPLLPSWHDRSACQQDRRTGKECGAPDLPFTVVSSIPPPAHSFLLLPCACLFLL